MSTFETLAVPLKKAEEADIINPVKRYIKNQYGNNAVQQAEPALKEIQQLRWDAGRNAVPAQKSTRTNLQSYYHALGLLETQIRISPHSDAAQVKFAWGDSFNRQTTRMSNATFEKCAVMFNIGAVTSQMAQIIVRSTQEEAAQAAKLFQEAAGAFGFARDQLSFGTDGPADLGADVMTFLEKLMLAQAQQCAYDKAVLDGKLPSTSAKLAQQAASMFAGLESDLSDKTLASKIDRGWRDALSARALLLQAITYQHQAAAHLAATELGTSIARLDAALSTLASATPVLKRVNNPALLTRANDLQAQLSESKRLADKDNMSVYLQRVPRAADLPVVQGVLIVKSRLPRDEASGQEVWFGELQPDQKLNVLEMVGSTLLKLGQFFK